MTHSAPTPDATSGPEPSRVLPARGAMPPVVSLLAVVVAVALVVAVGLAGAAIGRSSRSSAPATITVTGTGTVNVPPNTIQFSCGVQTTRPTAIAAVNANDQRVKALERVLLADGVALKDIQTSNLDIWPDTNANGVTTGFTVQDTLDVTMHNFKQAGIAIDGAVKAAGNGITFDGITLSLTHDDAQLQLARARAMHNALSEAASDAHGGGASVGSILRISDQQESQYQPYPIALNTWAARSAAGVPFEPGSQAVTVQLTVVYALNG